MSDPDAHDSIRFSFSFRSPYAWLAAEKLESELGDLSVPIEMIPRPSWSQRTSGSPCS